LPERSVVKDYRIEHKFPDIGKRVMILNARRLPADNGRPDLVLRVISDRTAAAQAQFEVEGHREFQAKLIDSVREALLVLDWDLNVVKANEAFYRTFQVSPAESEGRKVYELGNGQWDIPCLRDLLENVLPDDDAFDDVEVEHEFESIGRRIILLNGRRLDHLDLILLAIRDVTERRRMEAQQQTVMRELHHRIKNVLTSVGALVSRTARESQSIDEFSKAFQSRLDNFARTQDFMLRAPEDALEIAEVLRLELQAQGCREGEDFSMEGPPLTLPPEAARAIAMASHELTTNAIKHGALASPHGQVQIAWKLRAPEGGKTHVWFHWKEHGVSIDISSDTKGYGLNVLERIFRHSLNGTSNWNPDGAEFVAEFHIDSRALCHRAFARGWWVKRSDVTRTGGGVDRRLSGLGGAAHVSAGQDRPAHLTRPGFLC
jgi:two-component sensor histidine kinase/PAS domain-containing protein